MMKKSTTAIKNTATAFPVGDASHAGGPPAGVTNQSGGFRATKLAKVPVNIAQWNVRTLLSEASQSLLARTLAERDVKIAALSELRLPDTGKAIIDVPNPDYCSFSSTAFHLFYSGPLSSGALRGRNGVGFAVCGSIENKIMEWKPINDRVAYMRIDTSPIPTSLVSCYAPTNDYPDAVKDEFYDCLDNLMDSIPKEDYLVVLGDFNAQLGSRCNGEELILGRHCLGSCRTDNGDRLVSFLNYNHLFAVNTAFKHKKRHLVTWHSPDLNSWNQIDYVCVKRRWLSSVNNARSYWGTSLKSDHALLACSIKLKFSTNRRCKPELRIPTEEFLHPDVRHKFQLNLHNKFAALTDDAGDVEQFWNNTKETVIKVASSCVRKTRRKRTTWMSAATMELIQRRRQSAYHKHRDEIRAIDRDIAESIACDQDAFWIDQSNAMNNATRNGDTGKLFRILKRATGKSSPVSEVIRETSGDIITDQNRRVTRWAEHFESLLNRPPPALSREANSFHGFLDVSEEPPSLQEVSNAIRAIRSNSAPGDDGIPPSLWKSGGTVLAKRLCALIRKIWVTETIPDDWKTSVIIPLFKKGDRTVCNKHRGISLLATAYKIMESVMLKRLQPEAEIYARENQCGFRPGRSTTEQILALRLLIEQRQEFRRPVVATFVDFKAAFDSVDRNELFEILGESGVPLKFVNLTKLLYRGSGSRVRVYGKTSERFPVVTGVKQGAILSPFLFNTVVDSVMRTSMSPNLGIPVSTIPETLSDLDYADDLAILSETASNGQILLDRLHDSGTGVGMVISQEKTKICHSNCAPPHIILEGAALEVVDDFTYLGSRVNLSGDCSTEISIRIAKASGTFDMLARVLWRNTNVSLATKLKVYNSAIRPVLLYACDTWSVTAEDLRRLRSFEFRCWRRILGVSYLDRVSNEEIIRRVKPKWLIDEEVTRKCLTLLGHVLRLPENRIVRKCLFAAPGKDWRRPLGGVRNTWIRQVKSLLDRLNLHELYPEWTKRDPWKDPSKWLNIAASMARDRHEWRQVIANVISAAAASQRTPAT
jgi:hypothetical protein